jgi:hypothetical protein
MMMRLFALVGLALALGTGAAHAEQMFVTGAENGQGYVFGDHSYCFVVTAAHVLDRSLAGQVRLTVKGDDKSFAQASLSTGIPGNIGVWTSADDVAVLRLDAPGQSWNPCDGTGSGSGNELALPDAAGAIILAVDETGTIQFVPTVVAGSVDGLLLVGGKPKDGQTCALRKGLSGGLVLDETKKILGVLTTIISQQCTAKVVPIEAINAFFADASFQLPLHPLSQQLTEAIQANDFTKYQRLIQAVGDPNSVDFSQYSPIGVTLNDVGAPSLGFSDDTPAQKQANEQACDLWVEVRLQIASDLVKRGADVNFGGPSGWTPLMGAAFGPSECVGTRFADFLIANKADLNRRVRASATALSMTVGSSYNIPVLRKLLEAGADADLRDEFGLTPIMSMVYWGLNDVSDCEDNYESQWTVAFKLLQAYSDMSLTMPLQDNPGDRTSGKTVEAYLRERYDHEYPGFDRCMRHIFPDLPKN